MNEETTTSLIDTALASGSASALDPEERQLQELVLAIRDDAPSPDPAFAMRMDARVAAGFPSHGKRRVPTWSLRRPQLAALGAAASLLVGLVVALSATNSDRKPILDGVAQTAPSSDSSGGGSTTAASTPGGASELAAPVAPAAAQKAAPSAGSESAGSVAADSDRASAFPVTPSPGGFVAGQNRKVERSAQLVLAAPKDKFDDVGDQVIAVTDRYRGFVLNSSMTTVDDKTGSTGSFDLRIPVRTLPSALRDLSALADVKSRTENASDVTASFVSARTRLEELNAERRGLLRRLEKALTDQAAAAIRSRIRIVNAQIQSQMSVLHEMRRRTSYASVAVTLMQKEDSGATGGISDGARDLRDSLVDAANLGLRVLGVALPIGLVLAFVWATGGWFSRRRREAVLD